MDGRILLAVDTSGPSGSVVLASDGAVLHEVSIERSAEQASLLVPSIDRALRQTDLARGDLGGVVVGEGPGSFTGVRVAAATAKGLTAALGVPLWAVSSLAAAAVAIGTGPVRYALFDARADRVYGACFALAADGVRTVVEPHGGTIGEVLEGADVPHGAEFVGDGAERHRATLEAAGLTVHRAGPEGSLARGLVAYLSLSPRAAPLAHPADWEPAYVRESSAARPGGATRSAAAARP